MKCQLAKICSRFQNIQFDNKKKCIQPFKFSYLAKKSAKIGNTEKKANGLEEEKRINLPKKMLSITVIIRIVRYLVNKYIVQFQCGKKPHYTAKICYNVL